MKTSKRHPQPSTSGSTNKGENNNSDNVTVHFLLTVFIYRCMMISGEWLNSLRGSGSCSLLGGLEKALALPDLDTILIVLGSR